MKHQVPSHAVLPLRLFWSFWICLYFTKLISKERSKYTPFSVRGAVFLRIPSVVHPVSLLYDEK